MNWKLLRVAPDGSHHIAEDGAPAYAERFDEVLKFHAPGLAPVVKAGSAWHIRTDGSEAYTQRFLRTFGFYEGLAAVQEREGCHHVLPTGEAAYRKRYAWCGNFQDGRCTVREPDGAYLHIDVDGRPAYADRWHYAGDYRDGLAVVQGKNGLSTHVDREGRALHSRWFVDLDVYHKGYARARDEDGWMHIDMHGKPVYSRRFSAVEPFYNGQARVERFDGALEVIDEVGSVRQELRSPRRSEFSALSADMVGFWRTQAIAVGVRLGVFEALPATEQDVAVRCGMRVDGARRLLAGMGELHLVQKVQGRWEVTPRGAFLRKDHPLSLAHAALEYAGPFSRMWEGLADALRSGSNWVIPDVFADVALDPARRAPHHRMLRSYARHDYAEVVGALGLSGNERIIDAGGGLGVLAEMVQQAFPSTNITVLDRPEVIELARHEAPSTSRVVYHAGDLFAPWGLQADAVILARVLHDWDDDAALRILRHARSALRDSGRIFLVEMLVEEGSTAGALCDLHLLVATGGRERSAAALGCLLEAAGFRLAEVRTIAALPSVVVGVAS